MTILEKIPFNSPIQSNTVSDYVAESLASGHLSGLGPFTKKCETWLDSHNGSKNLFVSSATHALEMMAILSGISTDDEVIVPSFTFVSTALAYYMRGARIVFADVDRTGNLDLNALEQVITKKTKVVVPVHYAGNSCDLNCLLDMSKSYGFEIHEDAAQAIGSKFNGKALGTFGRFGCYSFHETKNISAGEGGALILNQTDIDGNIGEDTDFDRAHIAREKGTNRRQFELGSVEKYTWVGPGSSYLVSDLNAAYLYGQILDFESIQSRRLEIWNRYYMAFNGIAQPKGIDIIEGNDGSCGNAHLFALVFEKSKQRLQFIEAMAKFKIMTPFHYVPLHQSPMGAEIRSKSNHSNPLPVSEKLGSCLVRLPLYDGLIESKQNYIIEKVIETIQSM